MKTFSIVLSTLVLVGLVIGNVMAGRWFFTQAVPQAKEALEEHLGVQIAPMMSGVWNVPSDKPGARNTRDNLIVMACHFLLLMGFVMAILIQIGLFYLLANLLTQASQSD